MRLCLGGYLRGSDVTVPYPVRGPSLRTIADLVDGLNPRTGDDYASTDRRNPPSFGIDRPDRMEARVVAARVAYYLADSRMLAGLPFKKDAPIAKLVASNAAMDNGREATQIHGGYSFTSEYVVARHYRDSKTHEVNEGTTEVQLMPTARELGLECGAVEAVSERGGVLGL